MYYSFEEELRASAYVHLPLPLHTEKGLEASLEKKPVLKSHVVWKGGELGAWRGEEYGTVNLAPGLGLDGGNALRLRGPLWVEPPIPQPKGAPRAWTGKCWCVLPIEGEDWSEYNRLSFWVKPEFEAKDQLLFIAEIKNDGEIKIPDKYGHDGSHFINVQNHRWNHIIWEIPYLPRDKIVKLSFFTFTMDKTGCASGEMQYYIDDVELQQVAEPEYMKGWQGAANRILYSTAGYLPKGRKTAISTVDSGSFSLIDASGNIVFEGEAPAVENARGRFRMLDFSDFSGEGVYRLKIGDVETRPFPISASVGKELVWKELNFLYGERCGMPIPGVHGTCHMDVIGEHDGKTISYCGGWHDAGNLDQYTAQTAEIVHALFETAERYKKDAPLHARILEEANWGLDFILRTRFGDGFRCTSASITRYGDNIMGNEDDVYLVEVHDQSLDNFLCAGVEAHAAIVLKPEFSGRAAYSLETARADFDFALEKYRKLGYQAPVALWEHTYPTGEAHFYAIASWASTQLYNATGEARYAAAAREFAVLLMECQETGEAGVPITGFFYHDKTHSSIVHGNHQCREHVFMQALVELAESQPDSADREQWERAMHLYAGYLKSLMPYVAPYGMVPSGVYRLDETEDRVLFNRMHLMTDYDDEHENHKRQIQNGSPIGRDHYVRCFPVWFNFRGNSACHLTPGKAAAMLGNYFGDAELLQIGMEQIYWMLGKNPFGQSIIYGVGENYPQLYAICPGELVGEAPVGIETFGEEDVPYWPQGNVYTYKEVWTTTTGRLLWILAEL